MTETPVTPRRSGPPEELLSRASFLLKRLGFLMKDRTLAALEPTGASPYDHAVLALLDEEPSETQAMIADALGYDRSHLVGVLDDLEERGLIERRRDPDDRRRHVVTLTPAGKETLTRLRSIAGQVEDDFFEPLDADERETLKTLLQRLAAHHDPRCTPRGSGS